jgi:hypothetical protein
MNRSQKFLPIAALAAITMLGACTENVPLKVRRVAETIVGKVKMVGARARRAVRVAVQSKKTRKAVKTLALGGDGAFATGTLPRGDRYVLVFIDAQGGELGKLRFANGRGGKTWFIPFATLDGKLDDHGAHLVDVELGEIGDAVEAEGFECTQNPLAALDTDGDGIDDLEDDDADGDGIPDAEEETEGGGGAGGEGEDGRGGQEEPTADPAGGSGPIEER